MTLQYKLYYKLCIHNVRIQHKIYFPWVISYYESKYIIYSISLKIDIYLAKK